MSVNTIIVAFTMAAVALPASAAFATPDQFPICGGRPH